MRMIILLLASACIAGAAVADVQRIEARRATLDTKLIREMFAATGARVPEKVSWVTRWDVKARVAEAA